MKVITDGYKTEELEEAMAGWLQSQMVNRAQDRSLSGDLANNLIL